MGIMDYAWMTGSNHAAEILFAIHRPLIAIDKVISGLDFTILELEEPPRKPIVVMSTSEVTP